MGCDPNHYELSEFQIHKGIMKASSREGFPGGFEFSLEMVTMGYGLMPPSNTPALNHI